MEESVWLYVGILSALIGLAVVVSLFTRQTHEQKGEQITSAVDTYKELCTQVCRLPEDTKLSAKSTFPTGTFLYTTDESICARLDAKLFCGRCPCAVLPGTVLNLSNTAEYFQSHDYTCSITKGASTISMGCSG